MTLPALALGLVCSWLLAAVFHLGVNGGPARLILFLIISPAGFAAGQWVASSQHWTFLPLGPLQMGPAILGSLLMLVVGHWLTKVRVRRVDRADTV